MPECGTHPGHSVAGCRIAFNLLHGDRYLPSSGILAYWQCCVHNTHIDCLLSNGKPCSCGLVLRGAGMNPVVDLWKLYQSASAEAKELDVAIRAGVKSHSSKYHNEHGKLLQAEHKRLVWLWKKRERQGNKLINSLTHTARQQASF